MMQTVFWLLLATVVLVPLVSWDGFIFGSTFAKTLLFYGGVEISFVIWAFAGGLAVSRSDICRSFAEHRRWRWILTGLLLASLVASAIVAYDRGMAFWSGYERMMGLVTWLHLFVFFGLLVSVFCYPPTPPLIKRGKTKKEIFFLTSALTATLVALIGIGEKFFGSDIYSNVGSTLYNSAFLGSYLVLGAFLVLWHAVREERLTARAIGWLGGFLVIFFAIVFTEARSALVGLAGGGFVMAALIAWNGMAAPVMGISPPWIRRAALFLIIIVIGMAGITFFLRDTLKDSSIIFLSRIGSTFSEDRTGSGRLIAWQVGWKAFRERPLLGWGIENFTFAFNTHYDPRLFNVEPWFDRAHNAIVDWGVTTGVFGLAAYLSIVVAVIIAFIRRFRRGEVSALALAGMMAAGFMQNMFTFDILSTYVLFAAVLAYVVVDDSPTFNVGATLNVGLSVGRSYVGFIVLVFVMLVSYFVIWQPMRENIIGKQAGEAFAEGADAQGYALVERALSYHTYGDLEVRRLVAEYVFEFIKKGGKRNPEAMTALYDVALEKMKDNSAAQPGEAKWPAYGAALGNLAYAHTGDFLYAERSERFARESLALSPSRQQHWLELGQALLVQEKKAAYAEAMQKAITLMPRYPIPHLNAAVGAIALGDREGEDREIGWLRTHTWDITKSARQSWDNPTRDREALVQAYYKAKRFSEAIVYQEMLVRERDKINDLIQLAALLKEAGRKTEAREVAEKIVTMDPAKAAEAETFIRSLGL